MAEYMDYDVESNQTSAARTFLMALFILLLSGGLGFFVARGDLAFAGLDLKETLSSVRSATSTETTASTASTGLEAPAATAGVATGATTGGNQEALLRYITDLETRITLDTALRDEPLLQGLDLRVESSEGQVTLTGGVATSDQKGVAERLAASIVGEDRVTSYLSTDGLGIDARSELARRVEFELFTSEAFDLETLDIVAEGGVVTLKGTVQVPAEALLAQRLAHDVPGVSEVVNELELAEVVLVVPGEEAAGSGA